MWFLDLYWGSKLKASTVTDIFKRKERDRHVSERRWIFRLSHLQKRSLLSYWDAVCTQMSVNQKHSKLFTGMLNKSNQVNLTKLRLKTENNKSFLCKKIKCLHWLLDSLENQRWCHGWTSTASSIHLYRLFPQCTWVALYQIVKWQVEIAEQLSFESTHCYSAKKQFVYVTPTSENSNWHHITACYWQTQYTRLFIILRHIVRHEQKILPSVLRGFF